MAGKIFFLLGRSSSGKDTFKMHLKVLFPFLEDVVRITTRPKRAGEIEGKEYFFKDNIFFEELIKENKLIEYESFDVANTSWYYGTPQTGSINLRQHEYIIAGSLAVCISYINFFGEDAVIPIYLDVPEISLLQRAVDREAKQEVPKCKELCRRFLADARDFSEENLAKVKRLHRFKNNFLDKTLFEVAKLIKDIEFH